MISCNTYSYAYVIYNIHILLFAANLEDNNDNDIIFYEDYSSLEHNENINENRDSDATQILAN